MLYLSSVEIQLRPVNGSIRVTMTQMTTTMTGSQVAEKHAIWKTSGSESGAYPPWLYTHGDIRNGDMDPWDLEKNPVFRQTRLELIGVSKVLKSDVGIFVEPYARRNPRSEMLDFIGLEFLLLNSERVEKDVILLTLITCS